MELRREDRFRSAPVVRLLALALCLAMLMCWAFLVRPSLRARYLFRELETLQLGSNFEDAQRLATKIGAKPYGACDRSFCEWDVRMDNSALPRWWRGAGEAFVVYFDVKNSFVVRKGTGYGIGIESDTFYPSQVELEEQENWGRIPIQEPVAAGWYTSSLYRYDKFVVYMTPKASVEDRQRYTAYNFSCFWKYKGCKDGRDLLPVAGSYPVAAIDQ